MKPKVAMSHLRFIADNQKTVSTSKIKKQVDVLDKHIKMLETDNRKLRNKIKRGKRIDIALKNGDKNEFMKLTEQLKEME